LAPAVAWLLSPDASYTTGAVPRDAGHGSQAVHAMAISLPGVDGSLSQVQPSFQPSLSSELLD
jgi:hypothetical protein